MSGAGATSVWFYKVVAGTPGKVRKDRTGPWRPYVATKTTWYAYDEACPVGLQVLIRRGRWEFMVGGSLVETVSGSAVRMRLLEDEVLDSYRHGRSTLSRADCLEIFGIVP